MSKNNIAFYKDKLNNLIIDYGTTISEDKITIQNQKLYTIEKIELNNGLYLNNSDINQLIQAMTSYQNTNGIRISSVNDVRNNNELMSIINMAWHS